MASKGPSQPKAFDDYMIASAPLRWKPTALLPTKGWQGHSQQRGGGGKN